MSPSRRTFLKQVSAAAALGVVERPERLLWAAPPAELIPEPDQALLGEMALVAVDAARTAGATFADVRVAAGQAFSVTCRLDRSERPDPWMLVPRLTLTIAYGVRAVVDGAWGAATGYELTSDAVAEVATTAVMRARANRPRRPRELELAPAPVIADGQWATPIEEDPFEVPVGEQADIQLAALGGILSMPEISFTQVSFSWQRSDRVFASSEGTLQVQRIDLGFPSASATADAGEWHSSTREPVHRFQGGGYGYEAVSRLDVPAELRRAAERAAARAKTLTRPVAADVGRYDLVCAAGTVAQLLTTTLGEAVNAERVLGFEANRGGTSFASPPAEVLGRLEVGSPLLTVRADRSQPHGATTVGWDDEGVAPEAFTMIDGGVLRAYQTNRQTGAELSAWYRSLGEPVRSHGCASGAGAQRPTVQLPNLTMEPAAEDVSVEDLIADTERGFFIDGAWGAADHQILNGQFGAGQVREIRNGRLGERVQDLAFQFITPAFWQGMDAVGGTSSAKRVLQSTDYANASDGIQLRFASVNAVPARFRQVNVLNTGATG